MILFLKRNYQKAQAFNLFNMCENFYEGGIHVRCLRYGLNKCIANYWSSDVNLILILLRLKFYKLESITKAQVLNMVNQGLCYIHAGTQVHVIWHGYIYHNLATLSCIYGSRLIGCCHLTHFLTLHLTKPLCTNVFVKLTYAVLGIRFWQNHLH